MKSKFFRSIFTGIVALFLSYTGVFAQYKTNEEAKEFINDRLTHSVLQKIDPDGVVTISSPGMKYKFNLRDASFNYNGGNNDDRVRVFCDECIENYEGKQLKEKTSRQSFLCDTKQEANEVIGAFRFLKKSFVPNSGNGGETAKKLKIQDITLGLTTVGEAIDFLNENLTYSMVMGVDENGKMTINAPDEVYLVDLAKAEFGYNDSDDGTKVRIYGDFCVQEKQDNGQKDPLSRKSFQAKSRSKAGKVIRVMYYLKSSYSDLDPAKVEELRNISGERATGYKTLSEAIDYVNDRLSYSIILGVDKTGVVTINAPEEIYRFSIHDVKLNYAEHRGTHSDWFPFMVDYGEETGIMVECNDCIKQFKAPGDFVNLDEQVFQCKTKTHVKEALKALQQIRSMAR